MIDPFTKFEVSRSNTPITSSVHRQQRWQQQQGRFYDHIGSLRLPSNEPKSKEYRGTNLSWRNKSEQVRLNFQHKFEIKVAIFEGGYNVMQPTSPAAKTYHRIIKT